MVKVGDLVRLSVELDTFDGAKGIIVRKVVSVIHCAGFYFEVQLLSGEVIIGLPAELELLENEVEI